MWTNTLWEKRSRWTLSATEKISAVCDGEDILIPGIMEHIERAGIHSGDSISVYPARTISDKAKETIAEYTRRLAKALHVIGMINIQFIVCGEEVYVIEVNSAVQPYRSLYQQSDGNPHRAPGDEGDPGIQTERYGI